MHISLDTITFIETPLSSANLLCGAYQDAPSVRVVYSFLPFSVSLAAPLPSASVVATRGTGTLFLVSLAFLVSLVAAAVASRTGMMFRRYLSLLLLLLLPLHPLMPSPYLVVHRICPPLTIVGAVLHISHQTAKK